MTDEYEDEYEGEEEEAIDGTEEAAASNDEGWSYEEKKRGLSKEALVGIVTIIALVSGGGYAVYNALNDDEGQQIVENDDKNGDKESDENDPFKNSGDDEGGDAGPDGATGPFASKGNEESGPGGIGNGDTGTGESSVFGVRDGTGEFDSTADGLGGNTEPLISDTGPGSGTDHGDFGSSGAATNLLAQNQTDGLDGNTGFNTGTDDFNDQGPDYSGEGQPGNTGINGDGSAGDFGTGTSQGGFESTGRDDLTTGPFPSTVDDSLGTGRSAFDSEAGQPSFAGDGTGAGLVDTGTPDIDRPLGIGERSVGRLNSDSNPGTGSDFGNDSDFNSSGNLDGTDGSAFPGDDADTTGIGTGASDPFNNSNITTEADSGSPFDNDTTGSSGSLTDGTGNGYGTGQFQSESGNLSGNSNDNTFDNESTVGGNQPFGPSNGEFERPTIGDDSPGTDTGASGLFETESAGSSTTIGNDANSAFGQEPIGGTSRYTEYTVQEGENFWSISRSVYGSARHFQQLADYNRDRVPNPARMRPGMKIVTPPLSVLTGGRVTSLPDRLASRGPTTGILDPDPTGTSTDLTDGSDSNDTTAGADETSIPNQGIYFTSQGYPMFRVGKDDTLTTIAAEHLGRWARWRQVYEMNRDQLDDPNKLQIGMNLKLPADASRRPLVNLNRTLR